MASAYALLSWVRRLSVRVFGISPVKGGNQVLFPGVRRGGETIHFVQHRHDRGWHFVSIRVVVIGAHRQRFTPVCHRAAAVLDLRFFEGCGRLGKVIAVIEAEALIEIELGTVVGG